jgi:hypothetical protein
MEISDDLRALINKVNAGELNSYVASLEGTDFGIFIPAHASGGKVGLMLKGYSQTERNLVVSVTPNLGKVTEAKTIGWVGSNDKDSVCHHGTYHSCRHCTNHGAACRHCKKHNGNKFGNDLWGAPELDYDSAVKGIEDKQLLLNSLATENFGLTLLHGHSDAFEFTKLPNDFVSVIANGVTSFRTEAEVLADPTFVPNIWRASDGKLKVAGGFSER